MNGLRAKFAVTSAATLLIFSASAVHAEDTPPKQTAPVIVAEPVVMKPAEPIQPKSTGNDYIQPRFEGPVYTESGWMSPKSP